MLGTLLHRAWLYLLALAVLYMLGSGFGEATEANEQHNRGEYVETVH